MTSPQPHSNSPSPLTIAIIGAGPAGLSLALALSHRHVPFHIYEAGPSIASIGAGVAFAPNALHAMALIEPRLREGFDKIATHNGGEGKRGTSFDFVVGMDCGLGKEGERVAEVKCEGGQSSAHRAVFLRLLEGLLPRGRVSFDKRNIKIEEREGKGGVTVKFEDGEVVRASAVVACDGIKSSLRKLVLGKDDEAAWPRFVGKYAYRGLIPVDKVVESLGEEAARNSTMWLGVHGRVVTYPIDNGERINAVDLRTKEDGKWDDERWVIPTDKEAIEADFADFGESAKKIISLISLMENQNIWAFFEHPPARTYHNGHVCLIGDAAHASTSSQGTGASMALEDALIMASLLSAVEREEDVESAFVAFDEVRGPRTKMMTRTSRECGELLDCEGVGIGEDRDALINNLGGRYKWIWENDLEGDLEVGMGILRERVEKNRSRHSRM